MSLTTALLAPFVLLLPVAEAAPGASVAIECSVSDGDSSGSDAASSTVQATPENRQATVMQAWPRSFVNRSFFPDNAHQVRIEQSVRIRIAPRTRAPVSTVRPDMLVGVPQRAIGTDLVERRMGKCISVDSIAAVQASGRNDLILYLSDRRMVRAQLERACSARDFYSGFYLSRSNDGRLCVDRDTLQSRSGANCRLSEMRQLVETGE